MQYRLPPACGRGQLPLAETYAQMVPGPAGPAVPARASGGRKPSGCGCCCPGPVACPARTCAAASPGCFRSVGRFGRSAVSPRPHPAATVVPPAPPRCTCEPFNSTPMAVNSSSSGSPHVRPMGVRRTCGEPGEIKKNTHPKTFTALFGPHHVGWCLVRRARALRGLVRGRVHCTTGAGLVALVVRGRVDVVGHGSS